MYKVLFLPRWYPSDSDRQNGVFIQKHARAVALLNEVVVLYAEVSSVKKATEIVKAGNLTEVIVYYKASFLKPLSVLLYLKALFSGWKKIRQTGFFPHLTHVHVLNRPALLALWLKWKHKIPFILSEHWSGYVTGKFEQRGIASGLFTLFVIKQAETVTVVSETLKAGMLKSGLSAGYRIIPNVVEVLPDAWKQQQADIFRFLIVADLRDEIKNISGILRAFAIFYQTESQAELIIAGDGPDRQMLELLARDASLPVHFRGSLTNEEVLNLIPSAHVVIINSRTETFSVVTLEAIFSGRPVISTRCGGPEQFIHAQNGMLIETDNDRQLADAMLKMKLIYTDFLPETVKNSIPNREQYSFEGVAKSFQSCYDEAVRSV